MDDHDSIHCVKVKPLLHLEVTTQEWLLKWAVPWQGRCGVHELKDLWRAG
jgi:hypothetical protein